MKGGTIVILAGVLIVIAGIAMMGVQLIESNGKNIQEQPITLINAEIVSYKLLIETGLLEIPLMVLGLLFIVIGAVMSRGK
jgi:hypothetical protein